MIGWGPDLSEHDIIAIQIDGLHLDDRLLMIGAVGIDVLGKSTLWASLRGPQRTPLPCRPCSIT